VASFICLSACRLAVDALAQRDGVEFGVGRLLFVKIGGEEADDVVVTKLLGPGDQRAVAGYFIVFDRLRIGDDCGVQHRLVLDLAGRVVGFLDQAVDSGAIGRLRSLAELLEDLIEALNLLVGLFQMVLEALCESRLVAWSIIFGNALVISCSA